MWERLEYNGIDKCDKDTGVIGINVYSHESLWNQRGTVVGNISGPTTVVAAIMGAIVEASWVTTVPTRCVAVDH